MPAVVRLPAERKKTETDISREIRKALDKLGIPNWRMQAGGYRGRSRGLPAGTPDILAAPTITVGWNREWGVAPASFIQPLFLWIEVKKPREVPTDAQLAFADRIRNRGHHWLCVTNLDEVLGWLKENHAR